MLIMRTNTMTSIDSMTNENSSFPGSNAIDKQPQRIAKSTENWTTIVGSASGITDVVLLNVVSDTATVKVIDHSLTSVIDGTDISIASSVSIVSSSTDFSGFADGVSIVMKNWSNSGNNGVFVTNGASTSNVITVTGGLTAEASGNNIEIVEIDNQIEEDITFAECKSYVDYFSGINYLTDRGFQQLNSDVATATVVISLIGTLPSIGLIYSGKSRSYGRTQYGPMDNIEDTSLYRRSTNGSLNQVQRPVLFGANPQIEADNNEIYQIKNLFQRFNANAMVFILIPEDDTGIKSRYILYGRVERKPRVTWNLPNSQIYQLEISPIGGYE